jgi:hypothetical protein
MVPYPRTPELPPQGGPRIEDLRGLWRRSLLAWPDGARDTTTHVWWLQGSRAYIDLRQPADLWRPGGSSAITPELAGLRGLGQLSREHCLRLARQEGFAGQLSFDGSHFQWHHVIDFQPPASHPDAGALRWENDALIETGRDIDYLERWEREPATPTQPCCSIDLRDPESGARASWLRVGPFFMFARDRCSSLVGSGALEAAVATASSLEHARELVNCEISFGSVRRASFTISASTLPWRIGDALRPQLAGNSLTTADRAPDGTVIAHRWEVTASEGPPEALHDSD